MPPQFAKTDTHFCNEHPLEYNSPIFWTINSLRDIKKPLANKRIVFASAEPAMPNIRAEIRLLFVFVYALLPTQEKANGKIIYKVVDISKKENEAIADKYEVTWSSLFVNDWKDGKENVNNMTEFSFSNARNAPDKFKEGIKSKIDELLKQL